MAAGHKFGRFVGKNYSPVVYIGAEESKSLICTRKQTIVTKALSAAVEVPASSWGQGLDPYQGQNLGEILDKVTITFLVILAELYTG